MTGTTIDVTELPPKDRHQTIFDRLFSLETGDTATFVVDHDPIPLRRQVDAERPDQFQWEYREEGPEREQGFRHVADQIDEETWRVTFLRSRARTR